MLPEHVERLPLGIIIDARQAHQRRVPGVGRRLHLLDKVKALANVDDGAGLRHLLAENWSNIDHNFKFRTVQDNALFHFELREGESSGRQDSGLLEIALQCLPTGGNSEIVCPLQRCPRIVRV